MTAQNLSGRLSLSFEPNRGQVDRRVEFMARGPGYHLFLTSTEAVVVRRTGETVGEPAPLALTPPVVRPATDRVLRMQLVGAAPDATGEGRDPLPGRVNYLRGTDPSRWVTDVPTFGAVVYRRVYRGIDLVYYGDGGRLEYDFVVAPGADPSAIRLRFSGATSLALDGAGALRLETPAGVLHMPPPRVYQDEGGARRHVGGGYRLVGATDIAFTLDDYDRSLPLVISATTELI